MAYPLNATVFIQAKKIPPWLRLLSSQADSTTRANLRTYMGELANAMLTAGRPYQRDDEVIAQFPLLSIAQGVPDEDHRRLR